MIPPGEAAVFFRPPRLHTPLGAFHTRSILPPDLHRFYRIIPEAKQSACSEQACFEQALHIFVFISRQHGFDGFNIFSCSVLLSNQEFEYFILYNKIIIQRKKLMLSMCGMSMCVCVCVCVCVSVEASALPHLTIMLSLF